MLQVKRIEIDGFRGFPKASASFDLMTPVVQLHGENHQGKSSVLNAIEWCLYGDQCTGVKSGIRERKDWEIVNRNASQARVELEIETDEGTLKLKRVEDRGRGKRGKTIEVTLADGSIKKGDNAEREITRIVRLSFRDFATTVYQHQETIREIIIQEPRVRNDAIDRLLGLTDYRNILDGIKMSKVADVQKELANEFANLQSRIDEALSIRQGDLAEKKEEAKTKRLSDEELNNEGLINSAKDIIRNINSFASRLGIATIPISPLSNWKEAQTFVSNARKALDRLWAQSPDIKEQSNLTLKRNEAENIRNEYDTRKQVHTTAIDAIKKSEQDHGTQEKIDGEMKKVLEDMDHVEDETRRISPKAKLVEEGISLLEDAALGYPTHICPLCGKTVPNLLEYLKREWAQKIEAQVRDLKARRQNLDKKKLELEDLKVKYAELTENVKQAKNQLLDKVNKAGEFLNKVLTDKDDPAALVTKEIHKIDERLKEIKESIENKREIIARVNEKIDRVILLHGILELENKIEEIGRLSETDEYKKIENIRDELSQFAGDIKAIAENVRKCSIEEAKDMIASAESAINAYFTRITENPGIQELKVMVDADKRTGGNSYAFLDQNRNELTPILSQGDLNSLALSIFLGLVKAAGDSHPLGFVLLDDPSQSLSTQQKKRLKEVLNEVSDCKKLLVSTMDIELQQFLGDLTKAKTIYEFSGWNPEVGPEVSKRT